MPPNDSKASSISVETPRFMTKRPSTARPISRINPDISPPSFDTSSRVFLTSIQQPIIPYPNSMPTPKKILSSSSKSKRTTRIMNKTPSNQISQEEEELYLNMSMALLEVKDEQGNPLVKAIRKLKTNRFQAFLNKYKQAEEELGQKICHMKTLELELKDSNIKTLYQRNVGNDIVGKVLQQRTPKTRNLPTAPDASIEFSSPIKLLRDYTMSPIAQKEPVASHMRAKSAHMEPRSSIKPQSAQGILNSRPKTALKNRNKTSARPQTATVEEVKFGIDSSGLDTKIRNETEPSAGEKKPYFFSKVPLFRSLAFGEESSQQGRSRSRPKSHVLAISLNNTSSPISIFKDKMSRTGYEKWSAIHSKREIDNTKQSLEKSRRERTPGTDRQVDLLAIKQWFDALTIKGNPVTVTHDVVVSENPSIMQCSNRKQRMEEKIKVQQGLMEMGKLIMGKRGAEEKNGEISIAEKLVKGKIITQKKGNICIEKIGMESHKVRKREPKMSWIENYSKIGLEAWTVPFTSEGMEKDGLQEENIDVVLREKAMESQENQDLDIKDM